MSSELPCQLRSSTNKGMSKLEDFLTNKGFHHIGKQILEYMEPKELATCCFVSRTWLHFILNDFNSNDAFNVVVHGLHNLLKDQSYATFKTLTNETLELVLSHLPDEDFNELLLRAALKERLELCKLLILQAHRRNIDLDAPLLRRRSQVGPPLLHSVLDNHLNCWSFCQFLIKDVELDVTAQDENGYSTLAYAIDPKNPYGTLWGLPGLHDNRTRCRVVHLLLLDKTLILDEKVRFIWSRHKKLTGFAKAFRKYSVRPQCLEEEHEAERRPGFRTSCEKCYQACQRLTGFHEYVFR